MIRTAATSILLAILLLPLLTGAQSTRFAVTYVSTEHVYLDGGTKDGLSVGDRLAIAPDLTTPALEVVFVAGHSASCRLLNNTATPLVGTMATLIAKAEVIDSTDIALEPTTALASVQPTRPIAEIPASTLPVKVTGTMTVRHHQWVDSSPSNLDFSQSEARLFLKAQHLLDENMTLVVRTRGRYDARDRSYSGVERTDWENRLWELSLTYDAPDGRVAFSAGRITPRNAGSVGYLDGLLIEWRATTRLSLGLLGGRHPDWLYRTENLDLTRFGSYLSYRTGDPRKVAVRQSLAVVGELHGGTTSRAFLTAQGSVSGRNVGLNHTLEVDLNTGWREGRAGRSVALSRAFVNVYWQAVKKLRLGLSYDNLRRYWTYEYRSIADSLFDDRLRQGVRARADWQITSRWWLGLSGGLRDRPDEPTPTYTYSVSVRRTALIMGSLSASIFFGGFEGNDENGQNYSAWLYAQLPIGQARLGYSRYQYTVQTIDTKRASWAVESGFDVNLSEHHFTGIGVEYNDGDDIDGWRIRSELGYRF